MTPTIITDPHKLFNDSVFPGDSGYVTPTIYPPVTTKKPERGTGISTDEAVDTGALPPGIDLPDDSVLTLYEPSSTVPTKVTEKVTTPKTFIDAITTSKPKSTTEGGKELEDKEVCGERPCLNNGKCTKHLGTITVS